MAMMTQNKHQTCIDECNKCAQACYECFKACLNEPDVSFTYVNGRSIYERIL